MATSITTNDPYAPQKPEQQQQQPYGSPLQQAFDQSNMPTGVMPSTPQPPGTSTAQPQTPQPQTPQPPGNAPSGPDPFAAMGGGVWTGSQWVDKNHPLAQQQGGVSPQTPQPPGVPGAPTPQSLATSKLAEYISQSDTIDRNDPSFRSMVDPGLANIERNRRTAIDEAAEAAGARGADLSDVERRVITERAGQQGGLLESQMASRELMARRERTMQAISAALAEGNSEKARALQLQLAQLEAAVRRESTTASTGLGSRDLDIRERLGMRGLDLDAMRILFADKQFGQDLGFRIGSTEAQLNNEALRAAFGG